MSIIKFPPIIDGNFPLSGHFRLAALSLPWQLLHFDATNKEKKIKKLPTNILAKYILNILNPLINNKFLY